MGHTDLYRLYDENWQLLYVGISFDWHERFAQHARTKFWWADVTWVTITRFDSRHIAEAMEANVIATEKPFYNIDAGSWTARTSRIPTAHDHGYPNSWEHITHYEEFPFGNHRMAE